MSQDAARELLDWEDLGAQPAARAFRASLTELLRRPAAFFRKMALSGGLHEPVTFFALILGAVVVLAFPAALSYFSLMRPDPARASQEVYGRYMLAAQGTGLALVLLPAVLAAGAGAMMLLGTAFHLAGKPFGARNWEGSLSVWFYSGAAALVPLAAALALLLLVSLLGCLIGLAMPGAQEMAAPVARWTLMVGLAAALLAGVGLLLSLTAVGCAEAFELDAILGAAAGVSGAAAAAALVVGGWFAMGWLGELCAFALAGLAIAALRRGGE
jgi:hypothetical protein